MKMKIVSSSPPLKVRFTGKPDPQRTTAWLRDLIAQALAWKAEKSKAA